MRAPAAGRNGRGGWSQVVDDEIGRTPDLVVDDAAARNLSLNRWSPAGRHRLNRLGSRLHALGPRPIAEAVLAAVERVPPDRREAALRAVEDIAELPPELVELTGAHEFARPPLRAVGGRP